jgi:hypothetical protein
MIANATLTSATPTTPGFCLECKSPLQLGETYYVCLCGSESTSSYYLPFSWVLNNNFDADVRDNGWQPPRQLAKAASTT